MDAHREIFSHIDLGWIVYILAAFVVAALIYGFYRRYRLWRLGKADNRFDNLGGRIRSFVVTGIIDGFVHRQLLGLGGESGIRRFLPKEFYPGITHFLIFGGCLFLLLAAFLDFVSHYIVYFLHGNTYLAISFLTDLSGVVILIGVILALIRRYILRPERLDNVLEDVIALALIFIIVLSGFILEGLRISTGISAGVTPTDWAQWSFLGYAFANAFGVGDGLVGWYQGLWWFHMIFAIGAIIYISLAFTKLTHILVSPLNVFFRSLTPKGALTPIVLEEAETFGAANIQDFTWKQLLDLDACTRCGRCQDNCPAYLSGKPLSPKKLIQDLKAHLTEKGAVLLSSKASNNPGGTDRQMIGEVILEDEIWACTTCRACQEQCPVFIEPITKIIEMRRNLVLERAQFPETAMGALRNVETRGHPWRGTMATRTDWADGLKIKQLSELSEGSKVDVLFWVGCTSALEERSMKIATAMGKVLKAAGVDFGILGTEETCCGDPARRMGNEYLFQQLVQQNIETFNRYGVRKIVTACPHCFNTIKNEYPQFGGNFEVWHHTEFIADLLKQGKLTLARGMEKRIAYHDSCYLGRYNDIYQAPREILTHVTGASPLEMKRRMERSFCCGAGGGRLWMEEQIGTRIAYIRTEEAIQTNAEILVSACPYCLQMFEDGIKALEAESSLKAMDVVEIIAEAIE